MKRVVSFVLVWLGLAGLALAQANKEENVQGLYEGTLKDARGEHKLEARVVAIGKGNFKVLIRQAQTDGKVAKITLTGKLADPTIALSGKAGDVQWSGTYSNGEIKGTAGPGESFILLRITRIPPTLNAQPPAGAIVLLDGKSFDEVTNKPLRDGTAQPWKQLESAAIEIPKGGMTSKRTLSGSFKLHVEFMNPLMPEAVDQARGNSGVFMPCGTEIQVLDSFGMPSYMGGGCGGLYRWKDPDAFDEFSLASLPPLQWQTYDIEYRVQVQDGKPVGKAHVTVVHNGIKIHDNVELKNNAKAGPLNFQDHGNAVQYRNIWVLPLEQK